MRKFGRITIGGIQQKIFNLVLLMILIVAAAYTGVVLYQIKKTNDLVEEAAAKQKSAVTSISDETMKTVIESSLSEITGREARIADDMFKDTVDVVKILGDYTEKLFKEPGKYPKIMVKGPDASLDGKSSIQLLTSDGVDMSEKGVAYKVALLGNLSELMTQLYKNAEVDSCYVAIPEGAMVLIDDHPSSKFDDEGTLLTIPIIERDWYQGAVRTGGLFFTDVVSDHFTGQVCIMCSYPVYLDGRLAAVVGADLFLNNMETNVADSDENGKFAFIVNDKGHVVFSPEKEGIFRIRSEENAEDLRMTDNKELSSFIGSALIEPTDVRLVEADGKEYYLSGAPVDSVGWAVVSAVRKEVADQPSLTMGEQYDSIMTEAVGNFDKGIANARKQIVMLLIIATIMALAGALTVSGHIVKPLETMTKRVRSISGSDLLFNMDDVYRTGDEIEVLAESFATMSSRTLQYVAEVQQVTAEKERLGSELHMARAIQLSQLPGYFPAFPEHPQLDLFASMTPAKEVGGDFYDFFSVDDDHIGLVIADVSGKGVPAALLMMVSRVLIKSRLQDGDSPGKALESVNHQLSEGNEENFFVTVWAAVFQVSTGRGIAVNAGHEHPAICRAGGAFELSVYKHSPAVATMDGITFGEHEFELGPGDRLFVYTDGVAEATNADNELFGTDRMLKALNTNPQADPEQIISNVKAGIDRFVSRAEQFDDITMMCLEYKGTEQEDPA